MKRYKINKVSFVAVLSSLIPLTSCGIPGWDDIYNTVTTNSFIKGVDTSSYASVASNFLWENKIVKKVKDNASLYEWNDFENVKVTNPKNSSEQITLQQYVDSNLYSYIDENGERIYDNFFKILKEQGDVNSIRLRLWVDPKDKGGNSYFEGGANDLETDIYIMKQAIKYGISDFNLDFHYSDFWADPQRQYRPKDWENLSESELIEKVKTYTYETLVEIYNQLNILPSSTQIGNEITKGFLWSKSNLKGTESNTTLTTKYIQAGIEGVKLAQEYALTKGYDKEVKIVLHLESPTGSASKNSLNKYFDNPYVLENVDIIGLTWYPFWNGNFDYLNQALKNYWNKWDKEIIIEEYSLPYTLESNEYIGDLNMKSLNGNAPGTSSAQAALLNSFMNSLSKTYPDKKNRFLLLRTWLS